MGNMTAMAIAESDLSLEQQIAWHLRGNFYPPIPLTMVEPCLNAIEAYWEDDTDCPIGLPEGVFYKGLTDAPAWAIIEQHRLYPFIEDEYYENED